MYIYKIFSSFLKTQIDTFNIAQHMHNYFIYAQTHTHTHTHTHISIKAVPLLCSEPASLLLPRSNVIACML